MLAIICVFDSCSLVKNKETKPLWVAATLHIPRIYIYVNVDLWYPLSGSTKLCLNTEKATEYNHRRSKTLYGWHVNRFFRSLLLPFYSRFRLKRLYYFLRNLHWGKKRNQAVFFKTVPGLLRNEKFGSTKAAWIFSTCFVYDHIFAGVFSCVRSLFLLTLRYYDDRDTSLILYV